jgi:alpha-mannosidase
VARGYEFNYPLIGELADVHKGDLPLQHSFVQLSPSNLVLTGLKKTEEGNSWVVQWYDARGEESVAVVTFPKPPKHAAVSNFLEEEGASMPIEKNSVRVKTKRSSIVTLKNFHPADPSGFLNLTGPCCAFFSGTIRGPCPPIS